MNVVDKFKELFPLNRFLTLNAVDKFKELFPLNSFLTLSMSWTSSKNCSLLTYTINVLDKFKELFPPNLHYQFLRQVHRFFLSTISLHYQCLGQVLRIVFFQQLPYTINIWEKFIELFSFNNFLTLSISWTSSKNCFLSTASLHYQYLGQVQRIVFFQQLPYTSNILDKFLELFSFNSFLTLSTSWTSSKNCFLSTASLH